MKYIFVFLISISTSMALPTAKVLKIKGKSFFNGKILKLGQEISISGLIKTSKRSYLKISVKEWGNTIVLGPSSKMLLDLSSKKIKKKYTFIKGACRWLTKFKSKKKGAIYTKNAALGVRGTDFLLKYNSLLGETEVVMFDGKVLFQNTNDSKDSKLITKGQWGGVGGRFGNKIGKVIDLPANIIKAFNKKLSF